MFGIIFDAIPREIDDFAVSSRHKPIGLHGTGGNTRDHVLFFSIWFISSSMAAFQIFSFNASRTFPGTMQANWFISSSMAAFQIFSFNASRTFPGSSS